MRASWIFWYPKRGKASPGRIRRLSEQYLQFRFLCDKLPPATIGPQYRRIEIEDTVRIIVVYVQGKLSHVSGTKNSSSLANKPRILRYFWQRFFIFTNLSTIESNVRNEFTRRLHNHRACVSTRWTSHIHATSENRLGS